MGKSAFMTGVAIANSMVGSSMIIFPLNFNKYGIMVNVLFVIFMSGVMALTCKLLVAQLLPHELDIAQSIKRKLGPTYFTTFGVMSSITLFLVSSVFFLLAVDIFYDVFLELFGELSLPQKVFKIILMFVFAALNYLKNLEYVFKLAPVAMGALIISTLTLIGSIPFNWDHINSSFFDFQPLSFADVLSVASINGFALLCHPSISPMIKENADQKSNDKAVYIGYGITTILYILVGVLGALSIFHRGEDKHNIIEYFSGSFQAPLIGFLVFIYLFLISAIFPYVSKNQALQLIPKNKKDKISNIWLKTSLIFGIVWLIMNTLFIIFDTSPLIVIGFITAVMGYYIAYFLPIYMTVKKGDYVPKNVQDENLQKSLIVEDEQTENTQPAVKQESILTNQDGEIVQPKEISLGMKIFYGAILLYGAVLFVSQLVSLFS